MIRKATLNDLSTIVDFNYNLAFETENIKLDKERLLPGVQTLLSDESKGVYYVYEIDGVVVGQIMFTKEWSDWRNGTFWWIQSVYVHKKYRRQGIFRQLFLHIKEIAFENPSVCGLRLYVEKENTTAQKTYHSLGMEETYYRLYEIEK